MTKRKHLDVIKAHITVAIPYGPEDNLLTLTTQIREQARKLTGYLGCETSLSKIPAPVESPIVIVEPLIPADDLEIPAALRRK